MKTIAYFKLVLLCFALMLCQSCTKSVDFVLLDGRGQRMSDYQGQWLIINFWAEWCAPCREEIPDLNQLYRNASEQNLTIIGISYDALENKEISRIITQWGIEYPVIASHPMPILPFKLPKSLPGNYIFNPQGELVLRLSGKQSVQSLTKLLNSLKKES
jgi:thiol-disulfide isomerase/thioredoxin